jgi:hypothetical protein
VIRPSWSRRDGWRWELWLADDVLGVYMTAEAAAHDVATKATGHTQLDETHARWRPAELDEWELAWIQ